jgi:small-conductance mechanosensitive channel
MDIETLLAGPLVRPVLYSLAVVASFSALRLLALRLVRGRASVLSDDQRRRMFVARVVSNAGIAVGLAAIWAVQIQDFVLSLTAVLVAVVIATKELILCLSGFVLRTGAGSFGLGDWVEIGGQRGEVVDFSVLSTTLLELETPVNGHGYTGRTLTIPNSVFLTTPVRNENFARNYVVHRFSLTAAPGLDPAAAKSWIETRAAELGLPFADVARRYNALIERKLGVRIPGPGPTVIVSTTDLGNVQFGVVLFCPTARALETEQTLTTEFLVRNARGAFSPAGPAEAERHRRAAG